jgi:hypothetical protein
MKAQSPDTSLEAERVHIELLRRASVSQRFALVRSWSRTIAQFAWQSFRDARPQMPIWEAQRAFLAHHYGQEVLDHLPTLPSQAEQPMELPDILAVMASVAEVLEELGVSYHLGGSVASSLQGIWRATNDIDVAANLTVAQAHPFVERTQAAYYVDEGAVLEAILYHRSFNLIHSTMFFKVDIFIPAPSAYTSQMFQRVQRKTIDAGARQYTFPLASAEDSILKKLEWYQMGGRVSDQQWRDVLGILKVQGPALDLAYLHQWAGTLQVEELLAQALEDAGLP